MFIDDVPTLCSAYHVAALLVVSQTYHVHTQCLCLVEEQVGIRFRAGTPLLHWYFFVDADAFEEDGFAVEQHLRALHFYVAEA